VAQEGLFAGRVEPVQLEDEIHRSYLDYAMSVIVGRALPDVRDGLKPVHRRILRLVTLDDAATADELFSVLLGEVVEARRSFIVRNAHDVRFLDI
jgi:hypothetical protein